MGGPDSLAPAPHTTAESRRPQPTALIIMMWSRCGKRARAREARGVGAGGGWLVGWCLRGRQAGVDRALGRALPLMYYLHARRRLLT